MPIESKNSFGSRATLDVAGTSYDYFRIDQVDVEGATPQARLDILRAASLKTQAPILDLDLDGLRRTVEAVGWVKSARVVRLLPDTVVISINQRKPMRFMRASFQISIAATSSATIR